MSRCCTKVVSLCIGRACLPYLSLVLILLPVIVFSAMATVRPFELLPNPGGLIVMDTVGESPSSPGFVSVMGLCGPPGT